MTEYEKHIFVDDFECVEFVLRRPNLLYVCVVVIHFQDIQICNRLVTELLAH